MITTEIFRCIIGSHKVYNKDMQFLSVQLLSAAKIAGFPLLYMTSLRLTLQSNKLLKHIFKRSALFTVKYALNKVLTKNIHFKLVWSFLLSFEDLLEVFRVGSLILHNFWTNWPNFSTFLFESLQSSYIDPKNRNIVRFLRKVIRSVNSF